MTTYTTERIQPGLELLDREFPNWESGIDLAVLDMGHWSKCIGGQIGGMYAQFAASFDRETWLPVVDSFNADHPDEAPLLTAAWARVITERRLRAGEREAVAL